MERVVRFSADRLSGVPPLAVPPHAAELAAATGPTISRDGMGAARAFALFTDVLAPACVPIDHPRSLGFVPSAPSTAASLFDLAVSSAGIYADWWLEGAGAIHAENQALRWLCDLSGLPAGAGGVFLSSGTIANLTGLAVALRTWRTRGGVGRGVVAVTHEAHASIRLAARVLDIDVLEAPGDARGRLTADALRETLDRPDAPAPFAVAATAGSTNAGMVDDLAGIAQVCRERGMWLHVDGAYGGAALACPEARPLFAGIEAADSIVIDPHKWFFAPLDCSALLYREPALARAALTQTAEYLDPLDEWTEWNPSDYGIHLTRRARGLPFWFSLAAHGSDAYAAAVGASIDLARATARLIDQSPELELVMEPELSVVLFRRIGWTGPEYHAWSTRLLERGLGFVTPTSWRGETLLRLCFVNPRTTPVDVAGLLGTLR